jgi:peptide/nickel transport system substrate-binding protein
MRPRVALAAASAVVIVAGLAACSKNTGNHGDTSSATKQSGGIGTAADSKGPAAPVKGAVRGGTVYLIQETDFQDLDPARMYINNEQVFGKLIQRQLTTFVDNPKTGKSLLVGDLATNTGDDISGGKCTKWKYTLKSGLKDEYGNPITSKEIAYNVARSYSPDLTNGPTYIQSWLANEPPSLYNKKYKGPYNGGSATPPGVTTPNDKTIIFSFKQPHCDMPYAASEGTTAPVPQAKDTKQQYTFHPVSTGPYKIQTHQIGTKIVLVRNKYWKASTDPLRHNYPDKVEVDIGPTTLQQSERMIADNGNDQYAVMQHNIDPTLIEKVQSDPSLQSRVLQGYTQFVWYLTINDQRITDINERKALNYALDKKAYIQAIGGDAQAAPASTIESPTTTGWKNYNAYPSSADSGNVAKAKQLLNGKHPSLVYAYANTATGQKYATVVQNSLQKAGFKITLKPIDDTNYYAKIGEKNNPYDLYLAGWGSDWPSGLTIIPPILDGRNIQASGNYNSSYFSNKAVENEIDKISTIPAAEAAPKWAALDKEIMTKYAPFVPFYYQKEYTMVGSKVGGCYLGNSSGWPELTSIYAKK